MKKKIVLVDEKRAGLKGCALPQETLSYGDGGGSSGVLEKYEES